ncbi:MAG TPA: hypothetical protein VLB50_07510 [Ignavibacteriaceae bacterium]|nr:hypothetical protein [Ignavibacteriaceae bacterium]
MSSGHQILTIACIVLFSVLVLNFYSSNTQKILQMHSSKSIIVANGLAQSLIEEIQTKAFDEKTINKPVWNTASLTSTGILGKDSGENLNTQFDDIDDYDGYTKSIDIDKVGEFEMSVDVFYVEQLNPDVPSSTQTYSKMVKVNISNESLSDTLHFQQVISY